MNATRQSGFTIIELMVFVAVFTVLVGVVGRLGTQARREHRQTTAYQSDLLACREALRLLEADLRAARDLTPRSGGLELRTAGGTVEYRVDPDGLWRRSATGADKLVRCVADLGVTASDGLAHVALTLRPRSEVPRRATVLTTQVALRCWRGE